MLTSVKKNGKNTIKARGSTAFEQNVEWVMGEWVIPLRLLGILEHLAVLKIIKKPSFDKK